MAFKTALIGIIALVLVAASANVYAQEATPEVIPEVTPAPSPTPVPILNKMEEMRARIAAQIAVAKLEAVKRVNAVIETQIERLKNLVEKLEVRNVSTESINALILTLEEKRLALVNSTNLSAAREALQEVHKAWRAVVAEMKRKAEEKARQAAAKAIERAKGLFTRLDKVVEMLKAKGIDTTELEASLSEAKAKIAEAEKPGQVIREVAHLLAQANKALAKARKELLDKAKELREAKPTPSPEASPEAGPEVSPSPAAEVTPSPTPEATPEASPEAEATPEVTPSPTP